MCIIYVLFTYVYMFVYLCTFVYVYMPEDIYACIGVYVDYLWTAGCLASKYSTVWRIRTCIPSVRREVSNFYWSLFDVSVVIMAHVI